MKIYRGRRDNTTESGTVIEVTERDGLGELWFPLTHHVRHSPTGMNWGYSGSGPSDLALAILWDHTGGPVCPTIYQRFKFAVIAQLHPENAWELAADTVQICLDTVKAEAGLTCVRCGDRGLIDDESVTPDIWRACDACDKGRETRDAIIRDLGGRP